MDSGSLKLRCALRPLTIAALAAVTCGALVTDMSSGVRFLQAAEPSDAVAIDNAGLRTWSDADGKHSVRATLVRIEGEKVALIREDNRELKVALSTLSKADRDYVAKMKAAKLEAAGPIPQPDATPPTDKKVDDQLEPDGNDQPKPTQPKMLDVLRAENGVDVDIGLAMRLDIAGDGSWKYQPDAAEASSAVTPTQVPLSVAFADHHVPVRTMLLPREKKALVAFRPEKANDSDGADTIYICDYDRGRIDARIAMRGETPLAISPDGALLLFLHKDAEARSGANLLTICSRKSDGIERLVTWRPYGDQVWSDIAWAEFVDSQQLVTRNSAGDVGLWRIPEVWPKWVARLDRGAAVALSPNRKYLAAAASDGIKIIDLAEGKMVGGIPAEIDAADAVAFHRDGKRLAVWSADRIRVWDLESAAMVQDFGLQRTFWGGTRSQATLDWVDDSHVLLSGKLLVDLDRRVACWEFSNVGTAGAVSGGRLWFVDDIATAPKLCSVALPNREAIEAVAKFTPEQTLVLQPGMKVAVEIINGGGSGDTNAAREALVKKLNDNGITIVPESTVRLVGEIIPGQTQKVTVRMWSATGPSFDQQMHEFTPRTVLLRLITGGEEVWKRGFTRTPPGYIQLQENESVDQALQRLTEASVEELSKYRLPKYLARIPGDNLP